MTTPNYAGLSGDFKVVVVTEKTHARMVRSSVYGVFRVN